MSRSHHASDCRSRTIGTTVSYTGSVFCSVSMSTNRRVHTLLHLICIQCRTNSLFCISERPLGRGDTSIFNLTRCISTGILSYTASLYNTSTPHRNLYVGITELIVTQQSPHGTYCFLFFTDGRETVRALHSDIVVVCQPLRCITLSLVASLVSLCEAWYTRAQLAVSLSLCRRKTGGRFNLIFCYAFNMQNNLKSVTFFREVF